MSLLLRTRWVELAAYPPQLRAVFQGAFRALFRDAKANARANASGAVLRRRTGELSRSVEQHVQVSGYAFRGRLTSDHPAAAAQELGATIPPRMIRPVRARALHWLEHGADVFAMMSRPDGFTLPARPWLSKGFDDAVPPFDARLAAGVAKVITALSRAPMRGGRA